MKVFRGPVSKKFSDRTHVHVFSVKPEALERSLKNESAIQFFINKDAKTRHSICTAAFEPEDIIPMINGLLSKLKTHQFILTEIREKLNKSQLNDKDLLNSIRNIAFSNKI